MKFFTKYSTSFSLSLLSVLSVLRAAESLEEESLCGVRKILPNRTVNTVSRNGLKIHCVEPAPALPSGDHDYSQNHFSDRPDGFKPQALVMHYTVCDWNLTLRSFSASNNEVSAH